MAYSIAFCETILAPVTPSNTARAGAIIFHQLCLLQLQLQILWWLIL
ncbi:hypothetical protein FU820_00805 [Campylobacter jejuni]|nr:hypothetical protein [Campylobacter jejuni]ECP9112317.1 hypothetical protein [Campylobacter jejuni]HED5288109.1 anion permease [Campylobacter jejuni]HED5291618.1 anion permease [Campylobacter jejuni]HED5321527.1 anion permease [Campylobacter jejuni]